MIELEEEAQFNNKALLVEPQMSTDDKNTSRSRLKETASLCRTLGLDVRRELIIPLRSVRAATLIGEGKIAELKELALEHEAGIIVFDFDLSPTMQRNLENQLDLCVIDRQEVIIQIFANRAQTREAVLQVDLARLQYSLPRLSRRWTNLSQIRGGVRGGKGAGEKKLELDHRHVRLQILSLQAELEKVQRQRSTQRQNRLDSNVPKIAIVGYTNSGKSSLLNALTSAGVLAEDKLFATLDPVTRKLFFPNGMHVLLTDTVGFVSRLPHQLIDSFRSTLEEATLADILLLVCDATHPDLTGSFQTTMEVLASLGCQGKKTIVALNKTDAVTDDNLLSISRFEALVQSTLETSCIHISVKTGANLTQLRDLLQARVLEDRQILTLHIPLSQPKVLSELRARTQLISLDYRDTETLVVCCMPLPMVPEFQQYL